MDREDGPSRATPEGQLLAFVQGLTALTGRRRAAARAVSALVLLIGGAAVATGAMWAFGVAFR